MNIKRGFVFLVVFILLINFSYAYEIFYYHSDNLGSPIAITNQTGAVVWSADYRPFGQLFNEVGNNSYKYNSKELDNSGLFYYGARYYDADLGRFTTADTVKGNIANPQTLNRYVYTLNNLLKYIDPSGRRMELVSAEYRDEVMNWMNKVTGGTYFWINEEGSFQYVGGFKGSKEQRKIYNLFVDIIENKNVVSLSVGEQLLSEVSLSITKDKDISEVPVSIEYGDFWLPVGKEGDFIYFNPQVTLVHELAHARGQMKGNKIKSSGEVMAMKYENYARRVLGLDERIFYAYSGAITSTITGMSNYKTVVLMEYDYILPEDYDKAGEISKRLGLIGASYSESYYFYPDNTIAVSKHWMKYNKKGELIGFK